MTWVSEQTKHIETIATDFNVYIFTKDKNSLPVSDSSLDLPHCVTNKAFSSYYRVFTV